MHNHPRGLIAYLHARSPTFDFACNKCPFVLDHVRDLSEHGGFWLSGGVAICLDLIAFVFGGCFCVGVHRHIDAAFSHLAWFGGRSSSENNLTIGPEFSLASSVDELRAREWELLYAKSHVFQGMLVQVRRHV